MAELTPVFAPIPSADEMEGPLASLSTVRRGADVIPLTGGGLVAVLHPEKGLQAFFHGEERLCGPMELELSGERVPDSRETRAGKGEWSRVIPLGAGRTLSERGLLVDAPPTAVLQWVLKGADGSPEGGRAPAPDALRFSVRMQRNGGDACLATAFALLPGIPETLAVLTGTDDDIARTLEHLGPLRARERLRARRCEPGDAPTFAILLDGSPVGQVVEALLALDEAPLALGSRGEPLPPFLSGVVDGAPTYLGGAALAEVGMGALQAHRDPLARSALETLAHQAEPPPLPLLHLSAEWATWTGNLRVLDPIRPVLDGAAQAIGGLIIPADLSTLKEALPPLPPPRHPSHDNTLTAARAVRSWVEGRLGIVPDAAFGRVRIGPDVVEDWSSLEALGLRVGDASLSVSCRRDEGSISFRLAQSTGRVPVNVAFEPLLLGQRVDRVLIGEEDADVEVVPGERGSRIRCQFPLDPDRTVTVFVRSAGSRRS